MGKQAAVKVGAKRTQKMRLLKQDGRIKPRYVSKNLQLEELGLGLQ